MTTRYRVSPIMSAAENARIKAKADARAKQLRVIAKTQAMLKAADAEYYMAVVAADAAYEVAVLEYNNVYADAVLDGINSRK